MVNVTGRKRVGNEVVLTIRQPDGTLAQIPAWMVEEEAAAMTVSDKPRFSLECLRGLRLELDACLNSLRGESRREGDEHASHTARPSAARSVCDANSAGDNIHSRIGAADAIDQCPSDGGGASPRSEGGQR